MKCLFANVNLFKEFHLVFCYQFFYLKKFEFTFSTKVFKTYLAGMLIKREVLQIDLTGKGESSRSVIFNIVTRDTKFDLPAIRRELI